MSIVFEFEFGIGLAQRVGSEYVRVSRELMAGRLV